MEIFIPIPSPCCFLSLLFLLYSGTCLPLFCLLNYYLLLHISIYLCLAAHIWSFAAFAASYNNSWCERVWVLDNLDAAPFSVVVGSLKTLVEVSASSAAEVKHLQHCISLHLIHSIKIEAKMYMHKCMNVIKCSQIKYQTKCFWFIG